MKITSQILLITLFFSACSTVPLNISRQTASDSNINEVAQPLRKILPKISNDNTGELLAAIKKALKTRTKGKTDLELTASAEKLREYMLFLGLTAKDFKKAEVASVTESDLAQATPIVTGDDSDTGGEDENEKTPSNLNAILRLFISSTQFLDCSSMIDWDCLEKTPELKPTADFRIEKSDLSTAVNAGKSLDMDVYFTEGWDGSERSRLADRFAEKINNDAVKSLSLAMYGIDDIKGSMSGVYQAIIDKADSKETKVRAVVDVMGFEKNNGTPLVFSYMNAPEYADKNIFGPSKNPETPEAMKTTFQYDGTPAFLRAMNDGIQNQEESRARIEWATARIMHNKFAVLENANGQKSVWTCTANISKNCMGVEANANMSVYVRNSAIAESYLNQFNLMFEFDKSIPVKSKLVTSADANTPTYVGRFHRAKYPVSKRLFKFDDGTKLRVHFAPTDDAEHRSIIPMLLSAKAGDEIRISMFGGTGYEIVRSMQYAAAKGANVRIAFDRRLGHGLTSWIRDSILNVNMPNPYIGKVGNIGAAGTISYRVSTWTGKNHYKAGTLSRKQVNGSYIPEQIIVGSQNWSSGGNDYNDENLMSIQNLKTGVKAAAMFNQEFDSRLWPKSKEERPKL